MRQLPLSPAFRLRWPLLILMGSIGLTALAAFDAQRTVRRQDEVVNRAIHEFSSFAAWSYGEHLKQQLSAVAAEAIGAVNHGGDMHSNPKVPDAEELVHYLPTDVRCDCHRASPGPNPPTSSASKLVTPTVTVARILTPDPRAGWLADPVPEQPISPS